MKLFYPNATRLKSAAKKIAPLLGLPLSQAQRGVARACGYRDWHDLENGMRSSLPSLLDQDLPDDDFIARQTRLSLELADALGVPNGDAQYALAGSRLTGDRSPRMKDQITIRSACFRATVMPLVDPRMPGAVGKLKYGGKDGEVVILRRFGEPTHVISHDVARSIVASFEYVIPPVPLPLFLPARLYLPYGFWTEYDGSEVAFSRDYKPLWRVRPNGKVERLEPWLRIRFRTQTYLWDGDAQKLWDHPQIKGDLDNWLAIRRIIGLPILADALPLLVNDDNPAMSDAADLLQSMRTPSLSAAICAR